MFLLGANAASPPASPFQGYVEVPGHFMHSTSRADVDYFCAFLLV